jgi:hypothetical protein
VKANNAGPRAGGTGNCSGLVVRHNFDDSIVEFTVRGQWSRQTAVHVYEAMRKSLAESPSAIIFDLHEMNDLDGRSAATWIAASQAAMTLQPPAQVALCAQPTRQVVARLRQLGCTRFLSLFVTVEQARAAVASALPLTDRLQLRWLPAHPGSLTAVRDVVALACRVWEMPVLTGVAQDVAVDLVADSLTHAGTGMLFTVSRRCGSLYLALRDRGTVVPPRCLPGEEPERLCVVTARSYVWGASMTHNGKVVWAVVRAGRRPA